MCEELANTIFAAQDLVGKKFNEWRILIDIEVVTEHANTIIIIIIIIITVIIIDATEILHYSHYPQPMSIIACTSRRLVNHGT
jgi:ABC-type polysaccharide/polyol phosphate export permease